MLISWNSTHASIQVSPREKWTSPLITDPLSSKALYVCMYAYMNAHTYSSMPININK